MPPTPNTNNNEDDDIFVCFQSESTSHTFSSSFNVIANQNGEKKKCATEGCNESNTVHSNGLCKKCYNREHSKRIKNYKIQADAEFLAKCQEASRKRRVTAQPKTYFQEYVNGVEESKKVASDSNHQFGRSSSSASLIPNVKKPKRRPKKCVGCGDAWTVENQHEKSIKLCILCFDQQNYRVCDTCLEWTDYKANGKCHQCYSMTQLQSNLDRAIDTLEKRQKLNDAVDSWRENKDGSVDNNLDHFIQCLQDLIGNETGESNSNLDHSLASDNENNENREVVELNSSVDNSKNDSVASSLSGSVVRSRDGSVLSSRDGSVAQNTFTETNSSIELTKNKENENINDDDEDIQVIDFIPNSTTKMKGLKQWWIPTESNNTKSSSKQNRKSKA